MCQNAVYIEPVYEGDTLRKVFHIRGMRAARDNQVTSKAFGQWFVISLNIICILFGQATVITVKCDLYNQHEKKVFELDKVF